MWFWLHVRIRTVDLDMCVDENRRDGEARASTTAVGIDDVEKKEKEMSAVGFEPTSANTVELESTPLDRSGTLT